MIVKNRNTFVEETVHFDRSEKETLIYIGKSCYSVEDLERVVTAAKAKDFNEALNYRVRKYQTK